VEARVDLPEPFGAHEGVDLAGVLGAVLVLVGVVLPLAIGVWTLTRRDDLLALLLDDRYLLALIVGTVAGVLARFVAVTEVAVARQRGQRVGVQTFTAYVVLAALALPAAFGVLRAEQARGFLGDIFAGSNWTEPLYVPPSGGEPGVNTVLLLGSDGGPDRFGDRVDSIILVSIHEASGRTALVSVPRNLTRLQFPPGTTMAERFPSGFSDLANAVYPYVENNADVALGFDIEGLSPAAVALAQSVGYSLDVRIDDYVFVDMFGFLAVVDALGGVTLDLATSVPLPPNIVGATRPIPESIGPGRVDLDGTLAIAYARSRAADSDYGRMERQRQLLEAIASQTSTAEALVRLPGLTSDRDPGSRRGSPSCRPSSGGRRGSACRPVVDVAGGVAEVAGGNARAPCCPPARSARAGPTAPRCRGTRGRCRQGALGLGTCSSTSSADDEIDAAIHERHACGVGEDHRDVDVVAHSSASSCRAGRGPPP
jgi:polyisoprenyl-teichoic acid--peptidoglycan teichoic acid transferase